MTRKLITVVGVLILGLALVAMSCAPAGEVKPADAFGGKTIDLTNPNRPGGSGYTIGQLGGIYLEKYTGATVAMTVRRGAGGLEGHAG